VLFGRGGGVGEGVFVIEGEGSGQGEELFRGGLVWGLGDHGNTNPRGDGINELGSVIARVRVHVFGGDFDVMDSEGPEEADKPRERERERSVCGGMGVWTSMASVVGLTIDTRQRESRSQRGLLSVCRSFVKFA
jgi:hypothetical protein